MEISNHNEDCGTRTFSPAVQSLLSKRTTGNKIKRLKKTSNKRSRPLSTDSVEALPTLALKMPMWNVTRTNSSLLKTNS